MNDRILAAQRAGIFMRLTKGAKILGRLWREGVKCVSTPWQVDCDCEEGATEFCVARKRWVALACDLYGEDKVMGFSDPHAVIKMMTRHQFEESGLTVKVELPGGAMVKVGAGGATWDLIPQLASLRDDPEALSEAVRSVQLIQGVFT